MSFSLHAAALALPGYIRLGGLRLPIYGLFAAAGLLLALWLSQEAAPRIGLSAEKLWDAGVFAVAAAFIASRFLLVIFDLKAFLHYPLLVLALPSLTYGGMILTGLITWAWLRWKRLPTLDTLDAWAPCAALLAAILSIGHFVEGTDAGMPTTLPWGVITPGDTVLGRTHPVQLYTAAFAFLLGAWLFNRLPRRRFAGEIAALALILGGAESFLLDMLRQPVESLGDTWLDPSQFIALAAMIGGASLYANGEPNSVEELTSLDVAVILENFANGGGGTWDWDAYMTERFSDPKLSRIQGHCMMLPERFPTQSGWCNEQGIEVIRQYARQLRNDSEQSKKELD